MANTTERRVNIAGNYDELIRVFEKMTVSVEEMVKLTGIWKEETKSMADVGKAMHVGIAKAASDAAKQQEAEANTLKGKLKKIWSEINTDYSAMVADMRKEGGIAGVIGEALPQQLGGVQSGLAKIKGSILSELPAGGLVSLMMYGAMREEDYRAQGATVMRQFQQSGQAGLESLRAINEEARELAKDLGKERAEIFQEFGASAGQFAQTGIDLEDTLKNKFRSPLEGASESAMQTASRLDSVFKLASGTSARSMSELMGNFNLDLSESASLLAGVGFAARDSGTSVTAFMTSVMRSSAAMRTMRVDIGEAANAQLKFAEVAQNQLGLNPQAAARYAETAMGQVTRGLAGMSVGMSAVLAERISERTPGMKPVTGLDAYYAFKEGFGGAGQKEGEGVFVKGIGELLKMAKETGGGESEQRFFLEKMVPGMGVEGSRVLMAISKDMNEGKTIQEALTGHQKELADAFVDRGKETSDFQKALLTLQDGIVKIGAGLLGEVVAGFKLIAGLIMKMSDPFSKAADEMIGQAIAQSDISAAYIAEGLDKMPEGMAKAFQPIVGVGAGFGGAREYKGIVSGPLSAMLGGGGPREASVPGETQAPVLTEEKDIKNRFRQLVTKDIGSVQQFSDLDKGTQEKLLQAYRIGEKKSGKGEEDFAKKARELLPGHADIDIIEGMAKRSEERVAGKAMITSREGKKIPIRVYVKIAGEEGYSAIEVEGQ